MKNQGMEELPMRAVTIFLFCLALFGTAPALQAQEWALKTPKEVLEANIKATGGAEAWAKVKTMRLEGTMEMDSPMGGGKQQGPFVVHVKLPGYSHRELTMETPMGEVKSTMVLTPEKAWAASSTGMRRTLPARDWLDLDAANEELVLLGNDAYALTNLETDIADTGPIYVVTVEHDGKTYKRHYDQISLMLVAAERPSMQGGKEWIYYSEYREVEGLKVAHAWTSQGRVVIQQGGSGPSEHTIEIQNTLEKIAFNVPVEDALFSE
jgi:hypothetical protein